MAPGWTGYHTRLACQTYGVTDFLFFHGRPNGLLARVGEVWYAGNLGYNGGARNLYGDRIALLAQLEVDEAW